MDSERIAALVRELDTSQSLPAEKAWTQLRGLGVGVVPYLADAYGKFRTWQGRTSLVFHSIRYARSDERAFRLGVQALRDRSHVVRWRACGLLAYSLRRDALDVLRPLLQHTDMRTREDAAAAIDAIEHQNHHLYVDRDHSGRSKWVVNDEDDAGSRQRLETVPRPSQADLRFDTVRITAWVYAVYWAALYPLKVLGGPEPLAAGGTAVIAVFSLSCAAAAWSATRRKRLGYYSCLLFSIAMLPGVPIGTILGWNMIRALRRNRAQFWPRVMTNEAHTGADS